MSFFEKQQLRKIKSILVSAQDAFFTYINKWFSKASKSVYLLHKKGILMLKKGISEKFEKLATLEVDVPRQTRHYTKIYCCNVSPPGRACVCVCLTVCVCVWVWLCVCVCLSARGPHSLDILLAKRLYYFSRGGELRSDGWNRPELMPMPWHTYVGRGENRGGPGDNKISGGGLAK